MYQEVNLSGERISTKNLTGRISIGTTDYNQLSNKPSINDITLSGNKTLSDLGIPTLKTSSVTMSSTATSGQYASNLDWNSYHIVNAWIALRSCQILVRPSLQNKVIFNIYEIKPVSGIYVFQPISDTSITVNFFYL